MWRCSALCWPWRQHLVGRVATSSIKDHVARNASGSDVAGNLERINPNHSLLCCLADSRWFRNHDSQSGYYRYDHHLVSDVSGVCGDNCWLWDLGTLLGRYETWRVAPLSLLVPVVGLASAALLLDERLTGLQFFGAVLIMTGLYINVFGLRWRKAVKVRG